MLYIPVITSIGRSAGEQKVWYTYAANIARHSEEKPVWETETLSVSFVTLLYAFMLITMGSNHLLRDSRPMRSATFFAVPILQGGSAV